MTLLTTHGQDDDPEELARQLHDCEQVRSIPYSPHKVGTLRFATDVVRSWMSRYPADLWRWRSPGLSRSVRTLLASEQFDVVVADFLVAEPNLPTRVETPVVLFAHNVEHQIWKRLAAVETRWWRKAILEMEWRKMRSSERAAIRRASMTIAVSADDRDNLHALCAEARVEVVPTGVDTDFFSPSAVPPVRGRLVFSGSMDWYPNEDAILYFAREIWPRLRERRPDLSMTVVGRNPSAHLREQVEHLGITVTGTVADVRPFLAEGEVYVVPMRVGGGTRLKIFEALAMGKAVVSTTIGAEGLGLTPGRHFVAADSADAMVHAISTVLDDTDRRRALEAEGADYVRSRYGWNAVTTVFAQALERATEPVLLPASAATGTAPA